MTGRDSRVAGIWAVLGLAIVPVIAACSLLLFPPIPNGELVAVPTAPPRLPAENGMVWCNAGLLSGVLVVHAEWGLTVDGGAGEPALVFWPNGYVGRIAEDRTELLDDTGRVVARTGDQIQAAGGVTTVNGVEGIGVCPGTIKVQGVWLGAGVPR